MRRCGALVVAALAVGALTACGPMATQTQSTPEPDALANAEQQLDDAVATVDGFWREHWSEFFDGTYTSPTVIGMYDGADAATAPTCGGDPLAPDNAYYCPDDDSLAWDAGLLVSGADIGQAWVSFVVAHEWGHAIQARIDPTLVLEQVELQADCFAGAALAGTGTALTEAELAGIGSIFEIPGRRSTGPEHGTAANRVDAIALGQRAGVTSCLPTEPRG